MAYDTLDSLFSAPTLAFDVESTGTHTRRDVPIGFSIAGDADNGFFIPVDDRYHCQLLADEKAYIAHNGKYDRSMVLKLGITVDNICDTMIAAHLCEEAELNLPYLIALKTGRKIREFTEFGKNLLMASYEELAEYFSHHARAAWILWYGYRDDRYNWPGYQQILEDKKLSSVFWDLEMPLVPVLSDMEYNGVAIDRSYLSELGSYFDEKIELLDHALGYWADKYNRKVNFNSPDQVADLFYDHIKIKPPPFKTRSGRYTLEGKYLDGIKDTHPIIPRYLEYKRLQKLKGTYVNALLRNMIEGRVYGNFNQTGTRTSRLSSSGPNLQNIPQRTEIGRRIRTAFIAREGFSLVKADADQVELKMMAIWSKDKYLLEAFRLNKDIHLETALRMFNDASRRPEGKTANFQMIYGGGSQRQRDMFFVAYPGVLIWTNNALARARGLKYVRTLFGRIRTIPELGHGIEKVAAHGDREAISTLIQGSTAEVVKVGMRRIWEDIQGTDIKMVLQVHDEVVFEVPDAQVKEFSHHVKERLQYDELDLPITYSVSTGKNWNTMTKVNTEVN